MSKQNKKNQNNGHTLMRKRFHAKKMVTIIGAFGDL